MSRYDDDVADDEQAKPSRPGLPVDPHRVLRALLRGKWWLLVAAVIGSGIGVLIAKFVVKHSYESTASIRYEGFPDDDPREAQRQLPAMVSITHSEPILSRLRDRMGLGEASIDLMRQKVQVESDTGSGLVQFTTTGDSAEQSAEMANALVEIFLTHHREQRSENLREEIASLDERIGAAERELQSARRTYDGFREMHGITDLTAEQEQAITQAAELRSDADLAQAEVQALEARVQQLEQALAETPRMTAVATGDSRGQRRLRELEQRLDEARGQGLSDSHPQVQALQRQVDALRRGGGSSSGGGTRMSVNSLHEQTQTSLAEARTELESARRRQQSMQTLAQQAQERTNRFSTIEGQAAGLLAQVNVKEALVNELNQRRARIENSLRDVQTGFRSVADARPPESAVPSKKKWVVAAGIPMAFMTIMIGMLLFRELRGLRVQTPKEVAWWGNGPVIGTTTWPRDPRALIDLIADMDDYAPDARGTMLVVGATDGENELATEIASQLNHDWSSTTLIDVPVVGALPPGKGSDPPPPRGADDDYDDDDDVISGEIHDAPSAMVLRDDPHDLALAGMDSPTEVDGIPAIHAPPTTVENPQERLVCTAWSGPEGQSLRRAARLADRVLAVVASNTLPATELAQQKIRLGRSHAVGFCLIAVTDDVARLPDRSGPVEEFWDGTAGPST